ncbi:MAG: hypothetical protein ACOYXT_02775 [Bacteroidota bacterium]
MSVGFLNLLLSERDSYSLRNLRYCLWVIFILLSVFGFVDPLLAKDCRPLLAIRYGYIVPVSFAACVVSHLEIFEKIRSYVTMAVPIAAATGFVAMMMIMPDEQLVHITYTQALIITVSFAPTMLGLRIIPAMGFGVFVLACFNVCSFLHFDMHVDSQFAMYFSNNMLLLIACVLGLIIRINARKLLEKNIAYTKIIEAERDKAEAQIEAHKKLMKQLVHSKRKLSDSVKVNNRLLSIISHDIRGPLASIKGIIDLFVQGFIDKKELAGRAVLKNQCACHGNQRYVERSFNLVDLTNRRPNPKCRNY